MLENELTLLQLPLVTSSNQGCLTFSNVVKLVEHIRVEQHFIAELYRKYSRTQSGQAVMLLDDWLRFNRVEQVPSTHSHRALFICMRVEVAMLSLATDPTTRAALLG